MASTAFNEAVCEMIYKNYGMDVDFSKYCSTDPRIIEASDKLNNMDRYTQHFLCSDEMWGNFLENGSHIRFEEACLFADYKAEYLAVYLDHEIHENFLCDLYRKLYQNNVSLLPPSVNESELDFSVVDKNTIRCGLFCYGPEFSAIIDLRKEKQFESFKDYIQRAEEADFLYWIEDLIITGAMDCFGHTRKAMYEAYLSYITGEKEDIKIMHRKEYSKRKLGEDELHILGWAYSSSCFIDKDTGKIIHIRGKK